MSTSSNLFLRFVLCFLFYCNKYASALHSSHVAPKCVEKEREALLNFKQEVNDSYHRLSSWGYSYSGKYQMDCCEWHGVHCDNQTGNVVKLDLRGPVDKSVSIEPLSGEISPSLLELKYLEYLDLSYNHFPGRIPLFFGSFTRLKYLNLSFNDFDGLIPNQLGNLSSLRTLDLSSWEHSGYLLFANDLKWLSPLQSLRHVYLDAMDLSKATHWAKEVSSLPKLRVLHLYFCKLPGVTPSSLNSVNYSRFLTVVDLSSNYYPSSSNLLGSSVFIWLFNFSSSLTEIDVSSNALEGPIPDGFANMVSLMHLDLSVNMLEGGIPSYFGNYTSLKSLVLFRNKLTGQMHQVVTNLSSSAPSSTLDYLNLNYNLFSGALPDTIAKLSSLKELRLSSNKLNASMPEAFGRLLPNLRVLDLRGNQISGILPQSIGTLSNLQVLYLGSNHFEGLVSESHFINLSSLLELDLSFNTHLAWGLPSSWIPTFRLHSLRVGHCNFGPHFPKWLQTQKNISEVDMSGGGISGIPRWFWSQMSRLKALDLSSNLIHRIPLDLDTRFSGLEFVNLSSNHLKGPIPRLPSNTISAVDLSKNRLSGGITFLCNSLYTNLMYMDLSHNQLSGELPDCWRQLPGLVYLKLDDNNLFGKIPNSIGFLSQLVTLHLRNNSFTGELPRSWGYSESLKLIDLGRNRLSGTIPAGVGRNLTNLAFLDLSLNNFSGSIPQNICNLSMIQILNLSGNSLSGTIPKCISNFLAMIDQRHSEYVMAVGIGYTDYGMLYLPYAASFTWKGREAEYNSTLQFVKAIDLSSNNLTGNIPFEITSLIGLFALNLSRNHLTGILPPEIGNLQSLDFLDLSRNQIHGEIPSSLSQISRLAVLDLSFNNLTGRIPTGTQLQSFNASSFIGNPKLCGKPLTDSCPEDKQHKDLNLSGGDQEQEEKFITPGFYVSVGLGFVVGFWGVCGTLVLNRSFRATFFESISGALDYLYVIVALHLSRLQRRLQG